MESLPDYKPDFPEHEATPLSQIIPKLDENGLDLLERLLQCVPQHRISAENALQRKSWFFKLS